MLVNLNNMHITGKDAEAAMSKAGIIANKNTVPFETRSPFVTSGVRLGTPACTTRGMKERGNGINCRLYRNRNQECGKR